MVGFLFAGALAGLGAIAWPLYLHLRRRHRRIQEIPSLRLFDLARQQRRRLRLEQFILMVSRVLVIAALFLLVSQPVWRTPRQVPLPLAPGEADDLPTVGIVLDDSLTAQDGDATTTRFELARAWLLAQVAALPPTTRYRIVSTTCPFVTPLLGPEAAADMLKACLPLPREGDAPLALRRLADALAGQPGCLAVAAPRATGLWGGLRPEADLPVPLPVLWFDTTDCRAECYLAAVEPAGSELVFAGRLAGLPGRMTGKKLRLVQDDRLLHSLEITPHDVLRGQVNLTLPPVAPGTVFTLSVEESFAHPWFTWYFQAGVFQAAEGAVVIIRPATEAGIAADKLITAILQSTSPETPLVHADANANPSGLAEPVAAIVSVGSLPSQAWRDWLADRCQNGLRVLCVPLAGETAVAAAPLSWYPAWQETVAVTVAEVAPLAFAMPQTMPAGGLDQLMLAGITELPVNQVVTCLPLQSAETILQTRHGQPLVQAVPAGRGGWAVILGATLNLSADSPVFHPVFPLLIQRLLLPAGDSRGQPVPPALVGQAMPMPAWFDRPAIQGLLIDPDGGELPLRCSTARPQYVPIDRPGVHVLQVGDQRSYRTANSPRPATDTVFSRDDWRQARPRTPARWLTPADAISPDDFDILAGEPAAAPIRTYDLSPLAVALLLAAFLVEVLCLLRTWQGARR